MQSVPCFTWPEELEFAVLFNDLWSCGGSAALVPESLALCKWWARELHVHRVIIRCFDINCGHLLISKDRVGNKCSHLHVIPWITIFTQSINSINHPPGSKGDRHTDAALAAGIRAHHPAPTRDRLQRTQPCPLHRPLLLLNKIIKY